MSPWTGIPFVIGALCVLAFLAIDRFELRETDWCPKWRRDQPLEAPQLETA